MITRDLAAHEDKKSMAVGKEIAPDCESPTNYPFDAIIVLGADIQRDSVTGKFIFNNLFDGIDPSNKLLGARSRAIAVAQAFTEKLAPRILITGGRQRDLGGNETTKAELLGEYIAQKLHIPSERLTPIGKIGNTLGNIQDTVDYLSAHPELLSRKHIAVLTNEFHIPRAIEMFNSNCFFSTQGIEVTSLSVEELLSRRSIYHARWVTNLHNNPLIQEAKRREEKGLIDFRNGQYSPTHQ